MNCSMHTKGSSNECSREPDPHEMAIQIPRHLHSEIPEAGTLRASSARIGQCLPAAYGAAGNPNRRGSSDGRPCSYVDFDTAQVFGVAGHGIPQGQEWNPHRTGLRWATAEFCRSTLMGSRVLGLGFNGRKRRSGCPRLHPVSGKGRSSTGPVAVDAALSGSPSFKPPALPEIYGLELPRKFRYGFECKS